MGANAKMDAGFLMESAECLLEEGESKAAEDRIRTAIRSYGPSEKKEMAAAMRRLAGIWEKAGKSPEAGRALLQRAEALEK